MILRLKVVLQSAVLSSFALLSGCGAIYSYQSGSEAAAQVTAISQDTQAVGGVRSAVSSLVNVFRRPPPPPRPEQVLTPQVLSRATSSVLLVEFEDLGSWAIFGPIGQNGKVRTWQSDVGVTLSINNSKLLVATRGVGRDLMVADTNELAALAGDFRQAGGQQTLRVHEYLDGENTLLRQAYVCDLKDGGVGPRRVFGGKRVVHELQEQCYGPEGRVFTNLYWSSPATGQLIRSVQWVSPENGRVILEQIVP